MKRKVNLKKRLSLIGLMWKLRFTRLMFRIWDEIGWRAARIVSRSTKKKTKMLREMDVIRLDMEDLILGLVTSSSTDVSVDMIISRLKADKERQQELAGITNRERMS